MLLKADYNQIAKGTPLKAWAISHLRTFIASLGAMSRQPLSSFMTISVIAIALALPSGMFVILSNASNVSVGWDNSAQISVFLKPEISNEQARQLMEKLRRDEDIKQISMIDKTRALNEFKATSGFGKAIEALGENPFPNVLAIEPVINTNQPGNISQLIRRLNQLKQVELAQLDLQWVKRLFAILEMAHQAIWVIATLLGAAVLLIVGNTIRLDIQNRRDEIEVTKLIGATNAFIHRPFLYTGLWYGIGGGLFAWLLTAISIYLLDDSVNHLAALYNSNYQLKGLSFLEGLNLIGLSCLLGLLGSWIAVSRHIREIEPH